MKRVNSKMQTIPVIWEDQYLVAVNKPPYISVSPSESDNNITVAEIICKQLGTSLERAGIIHRLDKNTSGVLLIAKDQQTLEIMQKKFKDREVQKKYSCLTHGWFSEEGGLIDAPIGRNPLNREKFGIFADGRESTTEFVVLKNLEMEWGFIEQIVGAMKKKEIQFFHNEATKYCLLEVYPKTGRTHQIRVHMKYIFHPIVGDEVYTGKKLFRFDHRWCPRQFLHASGIEFEHPYSRNKISIATELAEDLKTALNNFKE